MHFGGILQYPLIFSMFMPIMLAIEESLLSTTVLSEHADCVLPIENQALIDILQYTSPIPCLLPHFIVHYLHLDVLVNR